jgi:hypothetical protein
MTESEATDAGAAWFKANPEAMLMSAWREAMYRYGPDADLLKIAFCLGVRNARRQHDQYLAERGE